ncbi:hypothetical protein Avbf_17826 [Armadillidium vulgare]|nr:hypothetical protein Avbf_17826 [Armadillidium vulgare]
MFSAPPYSGFSFISLNHRTRQSRSFLWTFCGSCDFHLCFPWPLCGKFDFSPASLLSDRENKVGSGPDRKSKVESGPDRKNKVGSGPGIAVLFTPLPFYYATCIPSVCTDEDLMVSLTQTFSEIDRKVVGLDCHEEGRSNHAKFDGFDAFVCEETNSAEVDMLLVNEKFQIDLQIC